MRIENRIALIVGTVALVAGIIALATLGGALMVVAGSVLLGLAGIAFVSLVFLLVGQSDEEDRRRHPHG